MAPNHLNKSDGISLLPVVQYLGKLYKRQKNWTQYIPPFLKIFQREPARYQLMRSVQGVMVGFNPNESLKRLWEERCQTKVISGGISFLYRFRDETTSATLHGLGI